MLSVPLKIKGDAIGSISGRNWDEIKDQYADYMSDTIRANYIPDLKAKLLKREAHSPLNLERKLSSAVRGTIRRGAMLPYQTGSMRPSLCWASTGPQWRTSIYATRGATRDRGYRWVRGGTPLK
jgi:phytoene dehydrogenase-like protein